MSACLTMDGVFANPASRSHVYGWQAEEKVEEARGRLAELFCCDAREWVWTSGATESNNLALKGVFEARQFQGHLITSRVEHKAVIDVALWLQERGVRVTWLDPDSSGRIALAQVADALAADTCLVSLMAINNESGAINPIAEVGKLCREKGVLFHVDAAQAVGRMPLDLSSTAIDLMSLSGHKFYAPKGVGALFVRRPIQRQIKAQMLGGGHERGLRSGTLATHQIVGLGTAAALVKEHMSTEIARLAQLREQLWHGLKDLPGVRRNSPECDVSPAHLNVCFGGIDGESLVLSLRQVAVSTGSACTSASVEPSYVLTAMGLSAADADSSIRFSLGRFTSADDITRSVEHIRQTIERLHAA